MRRPQNDCADYQAHLDFSKEIHTLLNLLKEAMERYEIDTSVYTNEKPICRRQGVCGIVSNEMCRRLALANNPVELAKENVPIVKDEEVDELHAKNYQLYQTDTVRRMQMQQHQMEQKD